MRDKALSNEFPDIEWWDEGLCFKMPVALKAEVLQCIGVDTP